MDNKSLSCMQSSRRSLSNPYDSCVFSSLPHRFNTNDSQRVVGNEFWNDSSCRRTANFWRVRFPDLASSGHWPQ